MLHFLNEQKPVQRKLYCESGWNSQSSKKEILALGSQHTEEPPAANETCISSSTTKKDRQSLARLLQHMTTAKRNSLAASGSQMPTIEERGDNNKEYCSTVTSDIYSDIHRKTFLNWRSPEFLQNVSTCFLGCLTMLMWLRIYTLLRNC